MKAAGMLKALWQRLELQAKKVSSSPPGLASILRNPEISETGAKANRFRAPFTLTLRAGDSPSPGPVAAFWGTHIRRKRDGGLLWANGRALLSPLLAKLWALSGNAGWREGLAVMSAAMTQHSAVHEMESAMRRLLILAVAVGCVAFAPAHAQDSNPGSSASGGTPSPGVPSSNRTSPSAAPAAGTASTDPALRLQGMPCSVSPNATGGVTTSSSCGTDPLSTPTRTLSSSPQSGSAAAPAQSSNASSSGGASTATSNSGRAASTASGGGAPSSSSTPCSSSASSTSGTLSAGSLIGGSGC